MSQGQPYEEQRLVAGLHEDQEAQKVQENSQAGIDVANFAVGSSFTATVSDTGEVDSSINSQIVTLNKSLIQAIAAFFVLTFLITSLTGEFKHSPHTSQTQSTKGNFQSEPFPKLLWIVCDKQFDGLDLHQTLAANHLIQVANQSGYEARVVTPFNAYEWLTPQTKELIRHAKHNSLLSIEIIDLLRIALLSEHGGVSVMPNGLVFVEGLDWIEDLFDSNQTDLEKLEEEGVLEYGQSHYDLQMIIFKKGNDIYQDAVFIAKRNASLVRETFKEMIEILIEGEWPYSYLQNIGTHNGYERSISMFNFFANMVSFKRSFWFREPQFCRRYRLISINKGEGSFFKTYKDWNKISNNFLGSKENYFRENGRTRIIEIDFNALKNQLLQVLQREDLSSAHADSFFREILIAEGNKWLLTPPNKTRDVEFCIISLRPLNINNYERRIEQSLSNLMQQTFKQWKAVYFVRGLEQQSVNISSTPSVTIVNASEWEGLNLQRAATKYCGEKDMGVFLEHYETFESNNSLELIAQKMKDKGVYAVFVSTKVEQTVSHPNPQMGFYRQVMKTSWENFRELAQHLRAFSLSSYRMVPLWDLHYVDGRYYNRELPLYTLVQSAATSCDEYEVQKFLKDVERRIQIPKFRVYLKDVVIVMPGEKKLDLSLPEYKSKFHVRNWCFGINSNVRFVHTALDNYFVMNKGSEFVGVQDRKHMPQLIPKKIHQIWIGKNKLIQYKKKFMEKIKALHPTYQYHVWGNDDITRENFPLTYDIIQTLFKIDKVSPVRKVASVADFMRLEIIYRQGGFYLDTNYYIFLNHTFDDWLTFQAVMPGQLIPNYKQQRENGFFGAAPGCKYIKKLLSESYLNTRNLFNTEANIATGPFYLALAIQGPDQLDEEVLVLSQDYIYPYYNNVNYCSADQHAPPEELLFRNKYPYKKDCENIYYWAFGMNFMAEGRSWRPN